MENIDAWHTINVLHDFIYKNYIKKLNWNENSCNWKHRQLGSGMQANLMTREQSHQWAQCRWSNIRGPIIYLNKSNAVLSCAYRNKIRDPTCGINKIRNQFLNLYIYIYHRERNKNDHYHSITPRTNTRERERALWCYVKIRAYVTHRDLSQRWVIY
jgi:hypothetical protein